MYTVDKLTKNLDNLNSEELEILFQVLTDNARLLDRIMPGVPLINYILTGKGDTAHALIHAYTVWKDKQ